ncbi:MAG: GIY-YIG nuclease family protein [Deltaproteobacteria bacterium]|nr:GIY-YIG nuclease family protein [Deltaproteobacteria bacterium]
MRSRIRIQDEFFRALPKKPGIYFMIDSRNTILYIGKAKSLRARLMSYRNAKPGHTPTHVLEMLTKVSSIRCEECPTEAEAFLREGELIRAVRPPFNIAGNWPAEYFFIGLKYGNGKLAFRLTSRDCEPDYRLFGCYKHRRRTKKGYAALLRLLYAALTLKPRFSFPARITHDSPPYDYSLAFPETWLESLRLFLSGNSPRFLHQLTEAMLANEALPRFTYGPLQADLETARQFYRLGPRATRRLRRKNGMRARLVSHELMDKMIAQDYAPVPNSK